MMQATVVKITNPFRPTLHREVRTVRRRCRVRKLAPNTQLPFICLVNGEAKLRADWDDFVRDGDIVAFVTLPQGGGGGSNPMKLIISIAISLAAPALATSILGPALAGTNVAFGITAGQLLGGAISMAGKMLVNAMMPDSSPKAPSTHRAAEYAAPSPTYNLNAQGNTARMGDPIPSIYGRHLIYPNFAAEPYAEYAGNEQYLYQLFAIGQGEYDIESIRIEDTPISSFSEISYEVVTPGQQVTLFPANVATASEVSGQEMLTGSAVGPYVVNPAGTVANALAVDVVAPRGLFYANDDGGLNAVAASFKVEAQQIDDAGTAIGGWITLGTHTISGATTTPLRQSFRYTLATNGRYQVKVTRTDTKNTGSRYGHEIDWVSARAYLPSNINYGNITLLAMRMRATNNLSAQSSRKINLTVTRKLPIWNGTTWSAPTATRNPAWAMADMLRADYGANVADSRIDLAQLLALSSTWASRGDNFDAVFDSRITVWEALTTTGRAGRCKPYLQGGIVRFTRDEAVAMPIALFNQRNIVRGSVKVEYLVTGDETADAVEVTYFDATTWKEKTVTASLPGSYAEKPAKVDMFGVTSRDHAWREGRYMSAANRYRRQMITFSTEMDGFIPTFGDLIAIAHDRPQWGQSGEVVGYDAGTKTLTLSEAITFGTGNHYFGFRKRDGSFSGPWLATAGVDEYHAVLDVALDFAPDTGTERERTYFAFGQGDGYRKLARVTAIKPRGMHRVDITCVNEDDAVHTADTGTVPPESSYWNLPARITRPAVSGVNVTLGGIASAPTLMVNWLPASGAEHYVVETSYDSGVTWQRVVDTTATNAVIPARRGVVMVRVAGVGISTGEWSQWTGDPYAAPPPDVETFLVTVQPDGTRQFSATMPGGLPPDFAGYKARYRLGTGWTNWNDLYPMHDGLVAVSPYETNQLSAGTYTFAIKAVDDSGNESQNAKFITADLADPRLAGVIYSVLPHTAGWPGTETNCEVEPEVNVLSATDSTTWADLTTWDAWTQWVVSPAGSMTYQHSDIDLGAVVAFVPLISAMADGTQTIEEQHSDDGVTWSSWAAAGAQVACRYFRVRITVAGAFPRLYLLDIKLNGGSVAEEVSDLATSGLTGSYRIGTGDIRVPIQKSYSVITQVQVALQNVGPGWSWEVVDKNTSVGPRIKIYNASNALADAMIDVYVRGY